MELPASGRDWMIATRRPVMLDGRLLFTEEAMKRLADIVNQAMRSMEHAD